MCYYVSVVEKRQILFFGAYERKTKMGGIKKSRRGKTGLTFVFVESLVIVLDEFGGEIDKFSYSLSNWMNLKKRREMMADFEYHKGMSLR